MTATITGNGIDKVQSGVIQNASLASGVPSTAKLPAGTVLQVVQQQNFGSANTTTSTTSSTYADILNLSATITPTSATSKILVISMAGAMVKGSATSFGLRLLRNGSTVWTNDRFGYVEFSSNWVPTSANTTTLDSPATTSAVTYKFQFAVLGGTSPNARVGDYENTAANSYTAVILMEIAA